MTVGNSNFKSGVLRSMLPLFLLVTLACEQPNQPVVPLPIMPLAVGNVWEYRTAIANTDDWTNPCECRIEIDAKDTLSGDVWYRMDGERVVIDPERGDSMYLAHGYLRLDERGLLTKPAETFGAMRVVEYPGGDSSFATGDIHGDGRGTARITGSFPSVRVVTPAGVFMTVEYIIIDERSKKQFKEYWAPGVGLIKRTGDSYRGLEYELVRYELH